MLIPPGGIDSLLKKYKNIKIRNINIKNIYRNVNSMDTKGYDPLKIGTYA